MSTTDFEDYADPRAESDDFDRGAEDMELWAARQEAEEECRREAYMGYLDDLEQSGVDASEAMSFEEFLRPRVRPALPLPPAPVAGDEDDILF